MVRPTKRRPRHAIPIGRALLFTWCLALLACAPTPAYVWVSALPPASAANAPEQLRPGYKVQLVVYGQDSVSGSFTVNPNGDVVIPVVGSVNAAGLTTSQFAQQLTQRLRTLIADPRVTVVVVARPSIGVTVVGEVQRGGHFDLRDGSGVLDALGQAGGFTEYADKDSVFVLRRGATRVRFRYADLLAANPASLNFKLVDGDVVIVD